MPGIILLVLQVLATIAVWKYWKWKALLPLGSEIVITLLLGSVGFAVGIAEDVIWGLLALLLILTLLVLAVMGVIKT